MGISAQERRAVHVDESTWRKAKVLAAAFGIPIYALVNQAINEMAQNYVDKVGDLLQGEVTHDDLQGSGKSE